MIGLKDVFMGREGNKIVYEYVFENEELARTMIDAMKQQSMRMFPPGYEKLIEEVEVGRENNKVIVTMVMKDVKTAECLFYLIKKLQGEEI